MLVTAVMITGKSPARLPFARMAVRSFLDQTWADKELLVLNDGEPLNVVSPLVREVRIDNRSNLKLGDLRNLAFVYAKGDLLCQFDDDDYSHPERIAYQMQHYEPGAAVVLRAQIRYSFTSGSAFYYQGEPDLGVHGTVLHERLIDNRYPSDSAGEDSVFIRSFNRVVVADNMPVCRPGSDAALYFRFHHGNNTWNERHIMRQFSLPENRGRRDLLHCHNLYLDKLLSQYKRVAQNGETPCVA